MLVPHCRLPFMSRVFTNVDEAFPSGYEEGNRVGDAESLEAR